MTNDPTPAGADETPAADAAPPPPPMTPGTGAVGAPPPPPGGIPGPPTTPPPPGAVPPPPGGTGMPPPGGPPVAGGPPPPGSPPIPGAPAPYGAPPPGGAPGFATPQFGTPGYAPGGYPPASPPGPKVTNGLAVASLVCGILGLVLFWACFAGLVLAIVAVVLGVMGRGKSRQLPGEAGSGMALAGMITGGIGVALGILMVVLFFVGRATTNNLSDVNSDPSDGVCNQDRWLQDPDC